MPAFLNASPFSEKNPEYGVAGLREAGVRVEYVRAGETTGDPSSSSSASWEVLVAGVGTPPDRQTGGTAGTTLLWGLVTEAEGGIGMEAGGLELFVVLRVAALGMFTLFLLVNSIWVSGRTVVPEELVLRIVPILWGGEYAACFAFESWISFVRTKPLVRRELLLDTLPARLMLESYKGALPLLE